MASTVGVQYGEGASAPTCARLQCWGDFALADAASGGDLKPRGRKARALLAYLALHAGKPVSRERLASLLWGDRADEQARASLRQALFELRALANGAGVLAIGRDAVTLKADALVTDIDELGAAARGGDYDLLLTALPDADEWLFANLDGADAGFDDWLRIERVRRRDELAALIGEAVRSAASAGQFRSARALRVWLAGFAPADAALLVNQPRSNDPVDAAPRRTSAAMPKRAWQTIGATTLLAAVLLALAGYVPWPATPQRPATEARKAEVAGLYATAHADILERDWNSFPAAESLLRRSVAIDPGFAPAWISLGAVVAMRNRTPDGLLEAERYVRRGLALAPDSAEAHGTLGMVLGFASPEARAAIKKAAALAPGDAQIQFWLSNVYVSEGAYARQLQALRRAVAIDPTWHRAMESAAIAAWEMGHGDEALRYQQQLSRSSFAAGFQCAYTIDWARGDYSAVVAETIAARPKLDELAAADAKLGFALLTLGYVAQSRLLLRLSDEHWQVASGGPPTRAAFRRINDDARHESVASDLFPRAVGQLVNAGRSAEIVALYDLREGLIGTIASGDASRSDLVGYGPDLALALRAVGRAREADALLARTERAVQRSLALGPVPNWFHGSVAQLRAAQGRRDGAIAALETAIDRGWRYNPRAPLPDIADLPAFRGLRGDPGFERLRTGLRAELDRERREAAGILA